MVDYLHRLQITWDPEQAKEALPKRKLKEKFPRKRKWICKLRILSIIYRSNMEQKDYHIPAVLPWIYVLTTIIVNGEVEKTDCFHTCICLFTMYFWLFVIIKWGKYFCKNRNKDLFLWKIAKKFLCTCTMYRPNYDLRRYKQKSYFKCSLSKIALTNDWVIEWILVNIHNVNID